MIHIICEKVIGADQGCFIDGSQKANCYKCQELIFISPYSQKVLAENPENRACCRMCFHEISKGVNEFEVLPMNSEQLKEFEPVAKRILCQYKNCQN